MPANLTSAMPSAASALPSATTLATELRQRLPAWPQVDWVTHTGSTQTDLLRSLAASPGMTLPALLGAHEQTDGRGRAGRPYHNQAGQALMLSCAFYVRLPVAALPMLSIWLGVATADFLRQHVSEPSHLTLKWPNDINWQGAKLAGMLLESGRTAAGTFVVAGLGLNLNGGQALSIALQRQIADWQHTGSATAPTELAAGLASTWQTAVAVAERRWRPGVGVPELPDQFAACDALPGVNVVLRDRDKILDEGQAQGVLPDGRLRLITRHGERAISVGEISLRPAP